MLIWKPPKKQGIYLEIVNKEYEKERKYFAHSVHILLFRSLLDSKVCNVFLIKGKKESHF